MAKAIPSHMGAAKDHSLLAAILGFVAVGGALPEGERPLASYGIDGARADHLQDETELLRSAARLSTELAENDIELFTPHRRERK